tara:strand:- start:12920 stop:13303 length:384 start_codon:yes stop_codon:yes gene_type:complete
MDLLSIFLTWQFLIFCLGLSSITFVVRKVVEYLMLCFPGLLGSKFSILWKSVLLPIGPVVNGAVAGFLVEAFPYPESLGASSYGRFSFGLVAGLFSGLVYRVVVELLKSKLSSSTEASGNPPPNDNV